MPQLICNIVSDKRFTEITKVSKPVRHKSGEITQGNILTSW